MIMFGLGYFYTDYIIVTNLQQTDSHCSGLCACDKCNKLSMGYSRTARGRVVSGNPDSRRFRQKYHKFRGGGEIGFENSDKPGQWEGGLNIRRSGGRPNIRVDGPECSHARTAEDQGYCWLQ